MSEPNLNAEFEQRDSAAGAPRSVVCPACGAAARRDSARFCATCGRRLADESYFPTDALLASYHQQRRRPALGERAERRDVGARRRAGARETQARGRETRAARVEMLFEKNLNGAAKTASAFVVYALVPYLGILFCPGALVMGGVGLMRARRAPHLGGGRASLTSIVLGLLLFAAHLVLWWILFKVPDWTRQGFGNY